MSVSSLFVGEALLGLRAIGILKGWDVTPFLPSIRVEILLHNTRGGQAQNSVVSLLFVLIPKPKQIKFD